MAKHSGVRYRKGIDMKRNGMAETGIVMSWYCSVVKSKVLTCIAKEE